MNGEETRFKKGDKAAEKWTEEDAISIFEEMFEFTMDKNTVVSVQQAYIEFGMHPSTYYYLVKKFPNLECIKAGINDVIISRVNKGAINQEMNTTACIWRMKQLGERDRIDTVATNTNINVELEDKEKKEAIDRVKKALNEFKDYE